MPGLSAYEQQRAARVKKNLAMMDQLGLGTSQHTATAAKSNAKKKKRATPPAPRTSAPLRRSKRAPQPLKTLETLQGEEAASAADKADALDKIAVGRLVAAAEAAAAAETAADLAVARPGWGIMAGLDPNVPGSAIAGVNPNGHGWHGPAPKRHKNGHLVFSDFPEFTPNMTPSEVLHAGSFGGGVLSRPRFGGDWCAIRRYMEGAP
eukprot:m.345600 g.345600  ORF g.345600 m.345600 type:complete len:207 (-) comp16560_c1_seq4:2080-2700(-)